MLVIAQYSSVNSGPSLAQEWIAGPSHPHVNWDVADAIEYLLCADYDALASVNSGSAQS